MGRCRSIFDALRDSVRLAPNAGRSKPPSVRLQREGDPPGHADEILWLQAGYGHAIGLGHRPDAGRMFRRSVMVASITAPSVSLRTASWALTDLAGAGGVAVPEHQPQNPVLSEYPTHLPEHPDELLHVQVGRALEPDLSLLGSYPIRAEAPIGGRGHAALDRAGRQVPQDLPAIAYDPQELAGQGRLFTLSAPTTAVPRERWRRH